MSFNYYIFEVMLVSVYVKCIGELNILSYYSNDKKACIVLSFIYYIFEVMFVGIYTLTVFKYKMSRPMIRKQ